VIPRQLAPSVGNRGDWISLSGRDPSSPSSTTTKLHLADSIGFFRFDRGKSIGSNSRHWQHRLSARLQDMSEFILGTSLHRVRIGRHPAEWRHALSRLTRNNNRLHIGTCIQVNSTMDTIDWQFKFSTLQGEKATSSQTHEFEH
jgi:hypothetical protein